MKAKCEHGWSVQMHLILCSFFKKIKMLSYTELEEESNFCHRFSILQPDGGRHPDMQQYQQDADDKKWVHWFFSYPTEKKTMRFWLFLLACIPIRLLMAWLAYVVPNPIFGLMA